MAATYSTATYGTGTYGELVVAPPAGEATLPVLQVSVAFATNPDDPPTYVDLSVNDILELSTERGRNEVLGVVETGVTTLVLNNQQRKFDPLNTSSPYYPNVIPVRRTRIRASVLGSVYDVAVGDIEDWEQDWQGRINRVPVKVLDGFDPLNSATFTMSRPVETSSARVHAILDAVQWPTADRLFDTGISFVQAIDYNEANALSEIQKVTKTEGGLFFINREGRATFHARDRRWKPLYASPVATFSNAPTVGEFPLVDAKVRYVRAEIRNRIVLTQEGGGTITKEDATSQGMFRVRTYSDTLEWADFNEAESRADYLLNLYRYQILRVESITLNPQMDNLLWGQVLGREIADKIRIKLQPPGTPTQTLTFDAHIEKVSHVYSIGRWTTTFKLSPAETTTFWLLGTNQLGVSTRLAY